MTTTSETTPLWAASQGEKPVQLLLFWPVVYFYTLINNVAQVVYYRRRVAVKKKMTLFQALTPKNLVVTHSSALH